MFHIKIPKNSRVVVVDDELIYRFKHLLYYAALNDTVHVSGYDSLNHFNKLIDDIQHADVIFLDHDLGPIDTIAPLINWMTDPNSHSMDPHVPIVIHSMNSVGATWMHRQLRDIGMFTNVNVIPVAWNYIELD